MLRKVNKTNQELLNKLRKRIFNLRKCLFNKPIKYNSETNKLNTNKQINLIQINLIQTINVV